MQDLRSELEQVLNKYNAEDNSNTPDFILAEYLLGCLCSFDNAVLERDKWYGVSHAPGSCSTVKDKKDKASTINCTRCHGTGVLQDNNQCACVCTDCRGTGKWLLCHICGAVVEEEEFCGTCGKPTCFKCRDEVSGCFDCCVK